MNEFKKTSTISERLNAIAGALETASIQARMLAEEIGIERTISAADVIAEVNRRAPMFFGTTTHESAGRQMKEMAEKLPPDDQA